MKVYLAHSLGIRGDVRKWEVWVEREFGVELVNPYFDLFWGYLREEVYSEAEAERKVKTCLKAIEESDAVLVVLSKEAGAGEFMALLYASMLHKPVVVFQWDSEAKLRDAWVVQFADEICTCSWEVKDVLEKAIKEKEVSK